MSSHNSTLVNRMNITQIQQRPFDLRNQPIDFNVSYTPQGNLLINYILIRKEDFFIKIFFYLCAVLCFGYLLYIFSGMVCFVPFFLCACLAFFSLLWRSTDYEYEFQPERLCFRDRNVWGIRRSIGIPKAWIRSIRVSIKPGDESPDAWTVELTWVDQKLCLLPEKTTNAAAWLGQMIATWAELGLRWQSPSGQERLYQRDSITDPVQLTHPSLENVVEISQGWQTVMRLLALLGLFVVVNRVIDDWLFWGITILLVIVFIFGFFLKLLAIVAVTLRFWKEGVKTHGVITQHWIEYAPDMREDQYYLAYSFPEGRETKVKVKQARYDTTQVGDIVQIRYLSTNSSISVLEGIVTQLPAL